MKTQMWLTQKYAQASLVMKKIHNQLNQIFHVTAE